MENINYPVPKQKYKVLVRCFTFNQSKYIEDALNGFAMQQTNFPFVCLVMDDASTDGEQEIIQRWMERECDMSKAEIKEIPTSIVILVPHKTNVSCTFAFYLLKQNLYKAKEEKMRHVLPWRKKCEYEALCEGDDYWIDSFKLQKQVDFLENNLDYGLVCSDVNEYNQLTKEFKYNFFKNKNWNIKYFFDDFLINAWFLAPCTWLYRKKYLENDIIKNKFCIGDLPLLLEISSNSKVKYLKESTAVYRVLPKSASHGFDYKQHMVYCRRVLDIQLFYVNKYNKQSLQKRVIARRLLVMAKISYNYREYRYMLKFLYNLLKMHICKLNYIDILSKLNI